MATGLVKFQTVYRWPYDYSKPGAARRFHSADSSSCLLTPESNLPHEQELVKIGNGNYAKKRLRFW
jgi:hypothetical protein